MATYLVFGGYGTMGRVAVSDLVETTKDHIIIAGRDGKRARSLARQYPSRRVSALQVDAAYREQMAEAFREADVVLNCAQYYVNFDVMEACLDATCHYLDLGGLFHMTQKQLSLHQQFRRKKLLALLGCGSTPGITNVMARYGADQLDRVEEIHVSFAGHDETPRRTIPFVIPYSAYTLFDEFTEKPAVLSKGKLRFVGPMTGRDKEVFPEPIGMVNGFYTLHSELATFPRSFKKKGLKECSFRVTFDQDIMHKMKFLIDAGLGSKKSIRVDGTGVSLRDLVAKELNRFVSHPTTAIRDREYVRVQLTGVKRKKPVTLTLDCLACSNERNKMAAGDIDTGVPPSIMAQMIMHRQITRRGVLPPELCVPPLPFFEGLKERGMHLFLEQRSEL